MSYVIQNFYQVNQGLVFTQKLYLIWVFRNSPLMISLSLRHFHTFIVPVMYLNSSLLYVEMVNWLYKSGFTKIWNKLVTRWKPLLGSNFTKGMQYWTYKLGSSLLEKNYLKVNLLQPHDNFVIYNQYYTSVVVSNISLHNKYYRIVMMKFLNLVLYTWQVWVQRHRWTFNFILINKNFHVLYFYNFYFFKMFNF